MKRVLFVGFILVSTFAYSQVEKGDKNVTFNALYTGAKGFGLGMFSSKIGYYITEHFEVGATPFISVVKFDGNTTTSPGLGVYGTYNWLSSNAKLLPYAGGSINIIKVLDDTQVSFGAYGGAKYFLTESVNIDGGMQLQILDGDALFIMQIGIGFVFKNLKLN